MIAEDDREGDEGGDGGGDDLPEPTLSAGTRTPVAVLGVLGIRVVGDGVTVDGGAEAGGGGASSIAEQGRKAVGASKR
ncbi:MAG: hypothetical protein R3B49_08485 [Phycisphaerales bacterium]